MNRGVIVGCDSKLEWILEWWWDHYSRHNNYPVAFMDFGMSEKGIEWCRSKGLYIPLQFETLSFHPVSEERKARWEKRAGKGVWTVRAAWIKKPAAFFHTPFPLSCWIDLDCKIECALDPIFQALDKGAEIALAREPIECQNFDREELGTFDDEVTYNSGVVAFRSDASILPKWVQMSYEQNHRFMGDQNALSRLIYLEQPSLVELDPIYNWKRDLGSNPNAKIIHYSGSAKIEIIEELQRLANIFS